MKLDQSSLVVAILTEIGRQYPAVRADAAVVEAGGQGG